MFRLVVNCTFAVRVTLTCCTTDACCAGGPSSALVGFLTRMAREHYRLSALRIRRSSHSLVLTLQGFHVTPRVVMLRVEIQLLMTQFCNSVTDDPVLQFSY